MTIAPNARIKLSIILNRVLSDVKSDSGLVRDPALRQDAATGDFFGDNPASRRIVAERVMATKRGGRRWSVCNINKNALLMLENF